MPVQQRLPSVTGTIPEPPAYTPDTSNDAYFERLGRYGRMHAPDYDWDAPTCTREAYGQGRGGDYRALRFHTTYVDRQTAVRCIQEIPRYNSFNPETVIERVATLPDTVRVVVAREHSPALYIWTDRPAAVAALFGTAQERGVVDQFPDGGVGADPERCNGWSLVRVWWD